MWALNPALRVQNLPVFQKNSSISLDEMTPNVKISVGGAKYKIDKEKTPGLYDDIMRYHKMSSPDPISIHIVVRGVISSGIEYPATVLPSQPLLSQLKKIMGDNYTFTYNERVITPETLIRDMEDFTELSTIDALIYANVVKKYTKSKIDI